MFSQLTFENAIQERNKHLTYTIDFFIGFTQTLHNGRFLWSDSSKPSNFLPFSMFKINPIQAANQQNCRLHNFLWERITHNTLW